VILPLTLIASVWGMNSEVPGQDSLAAFFIVLGGMLVILVGMVIWFKRRGWL
jgi:magnesium transporter